jgi:hypothetical protein
MDSRCEHRRATVLWSPWLLNAAGVYGLKSRLNSYLRWKYLITPAVVIMTLVTFEGRSNHYVTLHETFGTMLMKAGVSVRRMDAAFLDGLIFSGYVICATME